jgi:hypothetical protein
LVANLALREASGKQLHFLCLLLFLTYHVHEAGAWAVHIFWLVTGGRDRSVDIKEFAESTGAIAVTLQFHQFAVFIIVVGVD